MQIYIQDFLGSTPELKLSSKPSSPIMDPHLSPDGSMLAFVKDGDLHVMNLSYNEVRQLTFGANRNISVNLQSFFMNSSFLLKLILSSFCFRMVTCELELGSIGCPFTFRLCIAYPFFTFRV